MLKERNADAEETAGHGRRKTKKESKCKYSTVLLAKMTEQ